MRRYRIEVWPARGRALSDRLSATECTAAAFDRDNGDLDDDIMVDIGTLTLGQSVTLGGGAAPVTIITCIEE